MSICPVCRARNSDAATNCRSCATALPPVHPKVEPPPARPTENTQGAEEVEARRRRADEDAEAERSAKAAEAERRAKAAAEAERRAKAAAEDEQRAKAAAEDERRAKAVAEDERRAKAAAEEQRRVTAAADEERRTKARAEEERRAKVVAEKQRQAAAEEEPRVRAAAEKEQPSEQVETKTRIDGAQIGALASRTLEVGRFSLRLEPGGIAVVQSLPPRATPAFHSVSAPPIVRPERQHFIGRAAEILQVTSVLAQRLSRAVVLFGPHGIGKTSTLAAIAYDETVTSWYPDGILYLRGGHRTPEDVLQCVFGALFKSSPPFRPTDEQLHSALAGKRVLVLLDDLHFDSEALDVIARALADGGLVAATSQTVTGKSQAAIALGPLPEPAAIELLDYTVGRKAHSLEPEAADALCKSLEGNPLRIAQIGALARDQQRSLHTIVQDIAAHPSAAAVDRYVSLSLSPAERTVLDAAAAFGGASFDASLIGESSNVAGIETILEGLCRRKVMVRVAGLYEVSLHDSEVDPVRTRASVARALKYLGDWLKDPELEKSAALDRIEPFLSALGGVANVVDAANQRALISVCSGFSEVCTLSAQWGLALSTIEVMVGMAKHLLDREAEARGYDLKGTILLLLGRADEARGWHLHTKSTKRSNRRQRKLRPQPITPSLGKRCRRRQRGRT